MKKNKAKNNRRRKPGHNLAEDFYLLSNRILSYASRALPRLDFVREISDMLIDFSGCDLVEIRVKRREKFYKHYARAANWENKYFVRKLGSGLTIIDI